MPNDLVIRPQVEPDFVVLGLDGPLSLPNTARIGEATLKWLLDNGRVMVDLEQLRVRQSAWVSVFPTALAQAGGWPTARLVMFGADEPMDNALRAARIQEMVHLADDFDTAKAMLALRPQRVRRHHELARHPSAPGTARVAVREACQAWSVPPETCEIAELLASELVSNAVEHARSSSRLTLSSTGNMFYIAVRDWLPAAIPRPRPIDVNAARGRGLHLVAELSQRWGVDEHPDGKTIWVSVKADTAFPQPSVDPSLQVWHSPPS